MYGVKKDRSSILRRLYKMHRSHGNYPEQRLKLTLFVVCVYVYMYASNFATLNNTCFILLHEYIKPKELNDRLALLILNRTTGRYTPDSTVCIMYSDCTSVSSNRSSTYLFLYQYCQVIKHLVKLLQRLRDSHQQTVIIHQY